MGKGRQQPLIVPLVKSDARFIQHIEDTGELGSDLCGQSYPLALPTGQAPGTPVEGQVIQSHIQQESEPAPDLLQYVPGNDILTFIQVVFNMTEPLCKFTNIHGR